MFYRLSVIFCCICIVATGCRTGFEGQLLVNELPETHTITDTIIRLGNDRLESEVTIVWWGDDIDGFVVAYEFTFDELADEVANWQHTGKSDSVFILAPPPGSDTLDFVFRVRAIDNAGGKDPSPASLTYPIKNSPPQVAFIPGINNPISSFPALKYFWEGSDPDGAGNISAYEIVWNDTTSGPVMLGAEVSNILIEAIDPSSAMPDCQLFGNSATLPMEGVMSGMLTQSWNTLYIRSIDQSNAHSDWMAADSIYIKPVNSNILLVNAYTTASSPLEFYHNNLSENGYSVMDTLTIFESVSGEYTQQSADNLTQGRIFDMFDLIIWFGNGAENSLSLAQRTTEDFFADGGKLLMSVYISSSFDPLSNFLDFTPVASLVSPVDTTLLLDLGAALNPNEAGYPALEGTSIVGVVKPVNLQIGASPLYEASLTAKDNITLTFSPWTGNSIVIAKKNTGGSTSFILSTLELQKLDGLMNMSDFFQKILTDEFEF